MKKIILSLLVLPLFSLISFAECCDCQKIDECGCKNKKKQEQSECIKDNNASDCLDIDDDEYYTYNQCYFDKHFKEMKKTLCLTQSQERAVDNVYKCFKKDMEQQHSKFRVERAKLLKMIECNQDCYKNQKQILKEIKKDTKELCKCFREDIEEILCKKQQKDFRKFLRKEKKHMRKIIRYSFVVKLPCEDCCK